MKDTSFSREGGDKGPPAGDLNWDQSTDRVPVKSAGFEAHVGVHVSASPCLRVPVAGVVMGSLAVEVEGVQDWSWAGLPLAGRPVNQGPAVAHRGSVLLGSGLTSGVRSQGSVSFQVLGGPEERGLECQKPLPPLTPSLRVTAPTLTISLMSSSIYHQDQRFLQTADCPAQDVQVFISITLRFLRVVLGQSGQPISR
ncbi:unnamed protein product [Boreogadus saida]